METAFKHKERKKKAGKEERRKGRGRSQIAGEERGRRVRDEEGVKEMVEDERSFRQREERYRK